MSPFKSLHILNYRIWFIVARMIGPVVGGVLTVAVGPGWVFLINTCTFLALLLSLPLVGWVANVAGPRWSMAVAAASGLIAALIGLFWIIRARQLRIFFNRRARGLHIFSVVSKKGDTANGAARDDAVEH